MLACCTSCYKNKGREQEKKTREENSKQFSKLVCCVRDLPVRAFGPCIRAVNWNSLAASLEDYRLAKFEWRLPFETVYVSFQCGISHFRTATPRQVKSDDRRIAYIGKSIQFHIIIYIAFITSEIHFKGS